MSTSATCRRSSTAVMDSCGGSPTCRKRANRRSASCRRSRTGRRSAPSRTGTRCGTSTTRWRRRICSTPPAFRPPPPMSSGTSARRSPLPGTRRTRSFAEARGGHRIENVRKVASADKAMFWIGRLFGPGLSLAHGLAAALGGARSAVARWRRGKGAGGPAELGDQQALGAAARLRVVPGIHEWERFRYTCDGHRRPRLRLPPLQPSPGFPRLGQRRNRVGPAAIDSRAVALAFAGASHLGTQSLAVDVLKGPAIRLVIDEISYYYEGWAVEASRDTGRRISRGSMATSPPKMPSSTTS